MKIQHNCLILYLVLVKFSISLIVASSNDDLQVAFYCGRPANVFRNKVWTLDFQQDCLTNETKIVEFCQKSFPQWKILTSEPAVEKSKFKSWCDFKNQSCEVNVEIRPFKCLDKNFQSDALILPRNCQFGHLFNETGCLLYKHWVKNAKEECIRKNNWHIKSYGMLFPCSINDNKIKPMFFKGVEFVCCPNQEFKSVDNSDLSMYKTYLNNAVLDTEQGEQKFYEDAEKNLIKSEYEKETEIINELKKSEKELESLWKSDPEFAKKKEEDFLKGFKTQMNSIQTQFQENKEQLLNFHDNRLEFIFNTKFESAKRNLDKVMKKTDKTVDEIFEAMKIILKALMDRKKYLMAEFEEAKRFNSKTADAMYIRMELVDKLISDLFDTLKQVPNYEFILKERLMNYFTTVYPQDGVPVNTKQSLYDKTGRINIEDIIAKYKHHTILLRFCSDLDFQFICHGCNTTYFGMTARHFRSQGFDHIRLIELIDIENINTDDSEFAVHYDLGLNDPDQIHADFGKLEKIARHDDQNSKKNSGAKPIFIIVFGLLAIVLMILVGIVFYKRRLVKKGYSTPIFQNERSTKNFPGFGVNSQLAFSKEFKPHFYENMNYVNVHENPLIQTKIEVEEKSK